MTPTKRRKTGNPLFVNVKISEEAQIAARAIQQNFRPDDEMQEIYSMAIMEYLHAYHPVLEESVAAAIERRQKARREQEGYKDDEEDHQDEGNRG